jgi:hypothetical protein
VIRRPALAALALTGALATAVAATTATSAAGPTTPTQRAQASADRGSPGHWTKVSTGTVNFAAESSLARGANGDLHVVYARDFSATSTGLMHSAIRASGTVRSQNLLEQGWVGMDYTPALVRSSLGLRVLFAGTQDTTPGNFYNGNRIYTETSDGTGAAWTLSAQAASNLQDDATATSGTGATTLADGTPVVAFTHGDTLTWHRGTSDVQADGSYTAPSGTSLYNATVVRSGDSVWAAWFAVRSGDPAASGTFAVQIDPIPLPQTPVKAPGSSNGTPLVHPDSRVALAARAGGGIYAAYCVGSPCSSVRLWKVGTSQVVTVPQSKGATRVAISAGPSGRLWIAWSDGVQRIHAVRTGTSGMAMGAVRNAGQANGVKEVNSLAIEGSNGRGDIVVNVFGVLMHTQVFPGLTLHASPRRWHHGSRQRVDFTVTDAHDAVRGSRVKVGADTCTTDAKGTCSIVFPGSFGKGAHVASATRKGYGAASVVLRVR